jgi:hypothetical protein
VSTPKRNALWLIGLGGASAALFVVAFARSLRGETQASGAIASLVCLLVAVALGKLAHTMVRLARVERELENLQEHVRTEGVLAEIRALHTSHRLRELEALEEGELGEPAPEPRPNASFPAAPSAGRVA